jgi:hypothetical protein
MTKAAFSCLLAVGFAFLASMPPLGAADLPRSASDIQYEKILVPFFLGHPLPGKFGSLWATEAWITNNAAQPVDIQAYDYGCFLPEGCFPIPPTPPGISFRPQLFGFASALRGLFFFVDRRFASEVSIALRIRDLSRASMTWGTEVPVVREAEFRTGKLTLLDIPTGGEYRQVLRIYNLDGTRVAQVAVRVYALNPAYTSPFASPRPDPVLGQSLVSFQITGTNPNPPFSGPGYIEISDLSAIAALSGTERVHIEIESATLGLQFWAFVTVVNNDTQHLTVISPSP